MVVNLVLGYALPFGLLIVAGYLIKTFYDDNVIKWIKVAVKAAEQIVQEYPHSPLTVFPLFHSPTLRSLSALLFQASINSFSVVSADTYFEFSFSAKYVLHMLQFK